MGMAGRICPGHHHPGTIFSTTRDRACPDPGGQRCLRDLMRARETDSLDSSMLNTSINLPRIWFSSLINNEIEDYSPPPPWKYQFKRKYYY